jgi:hypothetical protein
VSTLKNFWLGCQGLRVLNTGVEETFLGTVLGHHRGVDFLKTFWEIVFEHHGSVTFKKFWLNTGVEENFLEIVSRHMRSVTFKKFCIEHGGIKGQSFTSVLHS